MYLIISCFKCINFNGKCKVQSKNKHFKSNNKKVELNKTNDQNDNPNTHSLNVD